MEGEEKKLYTDPVTGEQISKKNLKKGKKMRKKKKNKPKRKPKKKPKLKKVEETQKRKK